MDQRWQKVRAAIMGSKPPLRDDAMTPEQIAAAERVRALTPNDAFSTPIPAVQNAKAGLEDWLTGNVVDPLAARGWPNLGAALSTVPMTAADVLLPESGADLAGVPGVSKLGRIANKAGKKAAAKAEKIAATHDQILKESRRLKDDLHSITGPLERRAYEEIEWDNLGKPEWYQSLKERSAKERAYDLLESAQPGARDTIDDARGILRDVKQFAEDYRDDAMSSVRPQMRIDDQLGKIDRDIKSHVGIMKDFSIPGSQFEYGPRFHDAAETSLEALRRLNERKARLSRQLIEMGKK